VYLYVYLFYYLCANLLQVSRLDIRERKLRQMRARRTTQDDDKDDDKNIEEEEISDERHRQALLLINAGPPLQRDLSQEKMDFLASFHLTATNIADGQSVGRLFDLISLGEE